MLGDKDAIATLAVKDVEVARKFYEGKLGLKPEPSEESDVVICKSGNSVIFIYKSEYAGTNKATAVTWAVDDVHGVVQALKSKGIAFERYDFPDTTLKGDVHVSGIQKLHGSKIQTATFLPWSIISRADRFPELNLFGVAALERRLSDEK